MQVLHNFLMLGAPSVSEGLRGRVRASQISMVLRYTSWMMAASIANALAVVAVFWPGETRGLAVSWSCPVIAVAGIVMFRLFHGDKRIQRTSASLNAIRRATLNALIMGVLWAILPLGYAMAGPQEKLVIICVSAGMLCGAGFALSTIPSAAITFVSSIALGIVVGLWFSPSVATTVISIMSVVYIGVIVTSSLTLARLLSDRILADINSTEQRDVIGMLLNDFEENASDWLWVVDDTFRITHVSARFAEITGHPEQHYKGRNITDCLPLWDKHDLSEHETAAIEALTRAMTSIKPFRNCAIAVKLNERKHIWSISAKPAFDEKGKFEGYRGVGRDVTQEHESKAHIAYMARTDTLTNLPNRALFRETIEHALARRQRHGENFAVLLLDLDHFKIINDTQGHPEGDKLLVEVAERLRREVRDIDTVARLGGDEFAIVLSAIERPQEAANLADNIASAIARPFMLTHSEAIIGVSIGIAVVPDDGVNVDQLIRHADLALYRAKADGRGGYHFFESALDEAARRRHQLENDMRGGMERGEFELYFQPVVAADSRVVNGFEALMRWQHPALGQLSPAEFIPLAEETGFIKQLGAWAIRKACDVAMTWPRHIRVAVNLSAVQFRTPGLFSDVQKALAATGLAPDRLELEVTESLLLDTGSAVESTLLALRNLGVRLALDDFGTGYASLSYLRRFRFDKIKIDRSFVREIESDHECQAIVEMLIQLAGNLNMSLTAEGVETEGQLAVLLSRGCKEIQGFLISRPTTSATLSRFFEIEDQSRLLAAG